jgi:hypothetical protein
MNPSFLTEYLEGIEIGDTIPRTDIEYFVGVKESDKDYSLAKLAFRQKISNFLKSKFQKTYYVKNEGDGLRVLTEIEGFHYTANMYNGTVLKKISTYLDVQKSVNPQNLTPEDKEIHRLTITNMTRTAKDISGHKRQVIEITRKVPCHFGKRIVGINKYSKI